MKNKILFRAGYKIGEIRDDVFVVADSWNNASELVKKSNLLKKYGYPTIEAIRVIAETNENLIVEERETNEPN